MTNQFAKNLAYCRKRFKLSQSHLAALLSKGQSTVAGWENEVSEPSNEFLVRISDIFGVSLDELLRSDLEKIGRITDEQVANFQKAGQGKLSIKRNRKYDMHDIPTSIVSEPGPLQEWTILKILKEMDQKLDRLLENKGSYNKRPNRE